MPLTLTVPPAVARDVQTYAMGRGTTMAALVLEYLSKMALAERQTRKSENPVLKFCGVLSKGEADRMSAAVAEQRTITSSTSRISRQWPFSHCSKIN